MRSIGTFPHDVVVVLKTETAINPTPAYQTQTPIQNLSHEAVCIPWSHPVLAKNREWVCQAVGFTAFSSQAVTRKAPPASPWWETCSGWESLPTGLEILVDCQICGNKKGTDLSSRQTSVQPSGLTPQVTRDLPRHYAGAKCYAARWNYLQTTLALWQID